MRGSVSGRPAWRALLPYSIPALVALAAVVPFWPVLHQGASPFDAAAVPRLARVSSLALLAACAAAACVLARRLLKLPAAAAADQPAGDVAAVFAALAFSWHPLRVEAVAWAAAGGYLPAALFAILATLAYVNARAAAARRGGAWMAACLALLAASLLAKPIALALPLVFLALDYYPLGRVSEGSIVSLLDEKFPLFAVAALFAFVADRAAGAAPALADTPVAHRAAQAAFALAFYPLKLVLPLRLAPFYLARGPVSAGAAPYSYALAACGAFSIIAFSQRARRPWLLAAWLAYVAALLPFLGLWPFDGAMRLAADRWSLLPSLAWSVLAGGALFAGLSRARGRAERGALICLSAIALAALGVLSRRQTLLWAEPERLFARTMAVSPSCALCEHEMAAYARRQGRVADAAAHETEAARIQPDYLDAIAAAKDGDEALGRVDETIAMWRRLVRLRPDDAIGHFNLGLYCARHHRIALGIEETRRAAALAPDLVPAHSNLGWLLQQAGRGEDSLSELAAALELDPGNALARGNLAAAVGAIASDRRAALAQQRVNRGVAELGSGKLDAAIDDFRVACFLRPDRALFAYDLGVAYIQKDRRSEAEGAFRSAIALDPRFTNAYLNLGVILTAQGNLAEADKACSKAAELDPASAKNQHCYRRAR